MNIICSVLVCISVSLWLELNHRRHKRHREKIEYYLLCAPPCLRASVVWLTGGRRSGEQVKVKVKGAGPVSGPRRGFPVFPWCANRTVLPLLCPLFFSAAYNSCHEFKEKLFSLRIRMSRSAERVHGTNRRSLSLLISVAYSRYDGFLHVE